MSNDEVEVVVINMCDFAKSVFDRIFGRERGRFQIWL